MCGRFTLKTPTPVLLEHFAVSGLPPWKPRYNLAPSQDVLAVRRPEPDGPREAVLLHWGLIPSWSDDPTAGYKMINARAESVATRPAFRNAFRRRRCLIAADGFYEWQKHGRSKQPYYIRRPDAGPLAFAGLWEYWRKSPSGEPIESCTIITTTANAVLRELHDRMPVVLEPADYDLWLDPQTEDRQRLEELLVPCADDVLTAYPVGTRVNSPRHDDAMCVERQRMLF